MFGKLKEKLKKSLSKFSKKAEEEIEEEQPEKKKEETPPKEKEEKKGFFKKAKEKLTKKTISEDKFNDLFWDLELTLLENNVSVEVIEKIKADLKEGLVNKPLPRDVSQRIEDTLKESVEEILSVETFDLIEKIKSSDKPFTIAFFGINGSGKTTTLAKTAHLLQKNNLSCVAAAADTFRAAAIDQLEEHTKKLDIKLIKHSYGADAAAVAYDALEYAKKNNIDVVLIDTAGRLHSNINLMDELKKIIRVVNPNLKLFVGESITGNDCVEQAKKFNEHISLDALILTKADVDEKGGAPLSISYITKKPILYIGTGQNYLDLKTFDKEEVIKNIGLN